MRNAVLMIALSALAGCFPVPEERPDPWLDRPTVTWPRKRDAAPQLPTSLVIPPAARTFEEFLALPEERMDPGLGALLFSAEDLPGLPVEPYLRAIDSLAAAVMARIGNGRGPGVIDQVNQVLFFDQGFRYDPEDPHGVLPDNLHLHRVLKRKRGYCVSLGVLYLAVGKRLGLPLYGVRIPSHFIVRYDDGKIARNIETTDFGAAHPDSHYVTKYHIAPESVESGVYLANLPLKGVFVDLLNNRGTLAGVRGDFRAALSSLERGISEDPTSPFLFYNRGVILSRLGRQAEAEADFRKTLELDPNNYYAMNNVAEILSNRGDFDAALDCVNRALEVNPQYSNGYLNRGVILHRMDRKEPASRNIEKALELDSKNSMAYVYRARMLRDEGELLRAVHELNRAVGSDPLESQAWAERGFTYLAMGRTDKALPDFDKAVEIAPFIMEYRLNRGIARLKAGELAAARRDFDEAARLSPNSPEPLLKRAALSLLEKKHAEALEDLDRAVSLDRNQPLVLLKRGVALYSMRRFEEAEADLVRASELAPGLAEIHRQLGLLYETLQNRDRALYHLKRFLELDVSGDAAVREQAKAALERLGG